MGVWSGLVVNALVVMLCLPLTFLLNCYRIGHVVLCSRVAKSSYLCGRAHRLYRPGKLQPRGSLQSIDNRNFALGTATAQARTEARTPEPTDAPTLPLTGTPRSHLPTQTLTLLPTTVSPAAPDDETIAALITRTCFSHGVADVQVTVGRAESRQKGAIVTLDGYRRPVGSRFSISNM